MNDTIRMQLSAFIDDELPENEAELLMRRVCQDEALRKEAAEYLALSRLIRDEAGLAGSDRLHERVLAELDERPQELAADGAGIAATRSIKPLAGIAIAASVALLAIFGLQQVNVTDDALPPGADNAPVADIAATPQLSEEQRRQFLLNHADASSRQGANGINARLATMRFSEEVMEDDAEVEAAEDLLEELPVDGALEEAPSGAQ